MICQVIGLNNIDFGEIKVKFSIAVFLLIFDLVLLKKPRHFEYL